MKSPLSPEGKPVSAQPDQRSGWIPAPITPGPSQGQELSPSPGQRRFPGHPLCLASQLQEALSLEWVKEATVPGCRGRCDSGEGQGTHGPRLDPAPSNLNWVYDGGGGQATPMSAHRRGPGQPYFSCNPRAGCTTMSGVLSAPEA